MLFIIFGDDQILTPFGRMESVIWLMFALGCYECARLLSRALSCNVRPREFLQLCIYFDTCVLMHTYSYMYTKTYILIHTVKTRMVMQSRGSDRYYEGMVDCFRKILNEEGIWTFYKALPPRLAAVMPMIGIQFSVYELMKRVLLQTDKEQSSSGPSSISSGSSTTMKMYQTITENKQGLLKKEVTN